MPVVWRSPFYQHESVKVTGSRHDMYWQARVIKLQYCNTTNNFLQEMRRIYRNKYRCTFIKLDYPLAVSL